MSSSRSNVRFVVALAAAALFAGGGSFAMSACSSSTTEAPAAGTDASTVPDTSRIMVDAGPDPVVDSSTPQTVDQCYDACEKKAGAATLAKFNAVDTCWAASCSGPCVNDNGMYDAGDDAADAGNDRVTDGGGLCGTDESSGAMQACDDCTSQHCCAEWTGCYANTDCIALDSCYGDCNAGP